MSNAASTPSPNPSPNQVDFSTKLYYGFGAVANGATANGFNYLLLFYYSQVIGLRADSGFIGHSDCARVRCGLGPNGWLYLG